MCESTLKNINVNGSYVSYADKFVINYRNIPMTS